MTGRRRAPVIAIDGPAASGKTSTAAAVAHALGAYHLDSGALYRSLTRVALDAGSRDPRVILAAAEARGLALRASDREIEPYLDQTKAESVIRSEDVTSGVSAIAAMAEIRAWVNRRLRAAATPDRVLVLDGRDIGSDVFPDARVKVFLTASPEVRARRRLRQRGEAETDSAVAREARTLQARDELDSRRETAPLRRAPDAAVIDTTERTFDQQVEAIVALVRSAWSELP
jgi:cytidylate kinase